MSPSIASSILCWLCLASIVNAFRLSANYARIEDVAKNVDLIACPVLAGLYRRGHLKPDQDGKVSAGNLQSALEATGASMQNAQFQALGIAGYESDDPHQIYRKVGPMSFISGRFLNPFIMQMADDCAVSGNSTGGGFPCNANTQFQQHGYSTTMRDSRYDEEDPGGLKRFEFWIGQELVIRPDLHASEPVLLLEGMVNMLARVRNRHGASTMLSGDFNGEYSLSPGGGWEGSNLQKFHPSVTEPEKYKSLSAWQPLFAWSGWWYAFSRNSDDTSYFTRSDLETVFLRGEFPEDWEARPWGFAEDFEVMSSLKGNGLGDEWISRIEGTWRFSLGNFLNETRYNTDMLLTLVHGLGIQADDIHKDM